MGNTSLQLADICDLKKLYKMIEDWSNATGMSAILTDFIAIVNRNDCVWKYKETTVKRMSETGLD